jgi:NTE family protein
MSVMAKASMKGGTQVCGNPSYHESPHTASAQATPKTLRLSGLGKATLASLLVAVMGAGGVGSTVATAQPLLTPARPKVALVLSGGGARGFAHVGVLKALEAARVPVDMVVGTSMGAIIGGLYASGMSPDSLERELVAIEWGGLFEGRAPRQTLSQRSKEDDLQMSPVLMLGFRDGEFRLPGGAVSTRSLEWLLRRYTLHTRHLPNFDALPTPYRAVATDMETGETVVLTEGDLAGALRASMSVPGVFAPLELNGRILGDGGLVDNLPVSVARSMGADAVIAVNIGTPLAARETLGNVVGVSTQMINILTEQNVQRSIATLSPNDLLLTPPLGKFTSASFGNAEEIAQLGAGYARTIAASLERFSVSETDYAQWQSQRIQSTPEPTRLAFVEFEGVPTQRVHQLKQLVDTAPGTPLNLADLEDDLRQLTASGDYQRVDYQLRRDVLTQSEGLVFQLNENDWGPNYFRVGLALRTDFQGEGEFNLKVNHRRHWLTPGGTEWRNQLEIGTTTGLMTELYHPWGGERDRFVSAHAGVSNTQVTLFAADGQAQALLGKRKVNLGLDHGWTVGRAGALGEMRLGVFATRRALDLELASALATDGGTRNVHWTETGLRAQFVSDQLDHAHFPQAGHRLQTELQVGRRGRADLQEAFNQLELSGTGAFTRGPHTLNLHARTARVSDVRLGAVDEYALGGFHNMSGYKPGQLAGNHFVFGRLGYYRRLAAEPVISRALFAGATLEAARVWDHANSLRESQTKWGMSLYVGADTLAGPVYFGLVHAPRQTTGLYLFVGRP